MDDYDIIRGKRTYQYFDKEVFYPFGYVLTYTSFAYSGLYIQQQGETLKVCVTVRNTGSRVSDEVVRLLCKKGFIFPYSSSDKAFDRICVDQRRAAW